MVNHVSKGSNSLPLMKHTMGNPQNVMVNFVSMDTNSLSVKKQPYQVRASEWAYFTNSAYNLEPTKLSRKHII